MRKKLCLLLAVCLAGVMISGCGGSASSSGKSGVEEISDVLNESVSGSDGAVNGGADPAAAAEAGGAADGSVNGAAGGAADGSVNGAAGGGVNGAGNGALSAEQALSAAGNGGAGSGNAGQGSRSQEIIPDQPITIIDNDLVTVQVVRFFRDVYNEGREWEYVSAGFDIDVENKTDKYDISMYPRDCSLSDRRVIEFAITNTNKVAPGKIATMSFIRSNQEDFENLEALYELEGNLDMGVTEGNRYSNLSEKIPFSIPEAMEAKTAAADAAAANKGYESVIAALSGGVWLYNGGSDLTLNRIAFTDSEAVISQVYFDGNGKHAGEKSSCLYTVDDANIHVSLADGGKLDIPYTADGDKITLDEKTYFTLEQIDEGLQGYWKVRSEGVVLGTKTASEKHIYVNKGNLTSEYASLANGSTSGEYYYYGPNEGTYTLNLGGFDTNLRHGGEWFYNIINGEVTMINYDHICTRSDGFPGENGYYF